MSRNDVFIVLACAFAFAIITGGPSPLGHSPRVSLASLLSPVDIGFKTVDVSMFQHSFDHQ